MMNGNMTEERLTLLVKHLPKKLSQREQEDLLKHHGAQHVRCMGHRGFMKFCAFATFSSKEAASAALHRLHQLEVLGSCLTAEYSKKQYRHHHPSINVIKEVDLNEKLKEYEIGDGNKKEEEKEEKDLADDAVNSRFVKIAEQFGIDYPFNPRLKYSYPKPSVSILANIANALASVPKFYVQTLHLMNKMNLPCPFGDVTPTPPALESKIESVYKTVVVEHEDPAMVSMSESEESELESETEESSTKDISSKTAPRKRSRESVLKPRKKPKLQNILASVKPAVKPKTIIQNPKDVFETTKPKVASNPVSLSASISEAINKLREPEPPKMIVSVEIASDGFGKIEPTKKDEEVVDDKEEEWGETEFITSRQLRKHRLSSSQIKDFTVFKNYNPGTATTRLYIKNLAKQVTENDMHYIYGRYVDWSQEQDRLRFDIRLMKEGRMKGQAFVTLPNEEAAEYAIKETHAYVLHNKPMVVQFARSAKPKDAEKSSDDKK